MSYSDRPSLRRSSSGNKPGSGIVRRLSDKVMQSTRTSTGRRLEHFSAQRAQDARDALPLIAPADDRRHSSRQSTYYPPSPPASYQPHQLIAVCFNHMSGRDCEHCRNLDRSLNDRRSDSSPDSHHTLGYHSQSSGQQRHSNHSSFHDEKQQDGGEKGGKQGFPPVVGFWDSRLGKLRLQLLALWGRTTLILCIFILLVLSLYWGVLFHVEQNVSSLDVFVVDFDGTQAPYTGVTPLIGPLVTKTTEKIISSGQSGNHLGFVTMDPAYFNHDPMQVRQAVYDFKAWAAIVINANATALLQQAVQQGNASYDPLGACQTIWVEARDQVPFFDYIYPSLTSLQTEITSTFGRIWTGIVLQNTSIPITNLQAAPQALNPAIGFSMFSLRPFPPITTPAVTIGLIYLIIIAFFSFTFFLPIYSKLVTPGGHPTIKFWKFILIRWIGTVLAYFFMSLCYSFVSLAFQIPFDNPAAPGTAVAVNPAAYGKGTFVVYWMINFVGMIALGLACENVAMAVGMPWTAMWLIFWVITNVSTAFYSLDLAPKWYYWGYAWPLHNIVEASRSTLFDLHSRIGLNFGVLFAWCAINTILFPFACYFVRWKMMEAKRKEAQAKKN